MAMFTGQVIYSVLQMPQGDSCVLLLDPSSALSVGLPSDQCQILSLRESDGMRLTTAVSGPNNGVHFMALSTRPVERSRRPTLHAGLCERGYTRAVTWDRRWRGLSYGRAGSRLDQAARVTPAQRGCRCAHEGCIRGPFRRSWRAIWVKISMRD